MRARGRQQRARPTRRSKPSWLRAGSHTPALNFNRSLLRSQATSGHRTWSHGRRIARRTLYVSRGAAPRASLPVAIIACVRNQHVSKIHVRCTIARRRRRLRCTRCENAVPAGQTEHAQQSCETRAAPAGRDGRACSWGHGPGLRQLPLSNFLNDSSGIDSRKPATVFQMSLAAPQTGMRLSSYASAT